MVHREVLAPGGDFLEGQWGSLQPWFLGMLDILPFHLLAALNSKHFHASADIEGWQLGVGGRGPDRSLHRQSTDSIAWGRRVA